MQEKKVNLFLVGAMKAGTTFCTELLEQHSEIYCSPIKEPHFFVDHLSNRFYEPSRFFNLEAYFEKDFPKPLHITKIESIDQYKKLFSLADKEKYHVDASTCYLHDPVAANKIYEYNSDSKIIIITRNPLKRAYSDYQMNLALGRERKPFQEIMEKEISLFEESKLPWYSYIGMSFYDESINRYKNLFGKNVKVVSFEKLIATPNEVLEEIFTFLNIEPAQVNLHSKKNETRSLRGQPFFYFLKKIGLKDYFSKIVGYKTKQFLFRMISSRNKNEILLDTNVKQKLGKIFSLKSSYEYS